MSEEKAIIANLKKVFLMVSGAALQKYMMEIEKQQHLLINAEIFKPNLYGRIYNFKSEKNFVLILWKLQWLN